METVNISKLKEYVLSVQYVLNSITEISNDPDAVAPKEELISLDCKKQEMLDEMINYSRMWDKESFWMSFFCIWAQESMYGYPEAIAKEFLAQFNGESLGDFIRKVFDTDLYEKDMFAVTPPDYYADFLVDFSELLKQAPDLTEKTIETIKEVVLRSHIANEALMDYLIFTLIPYVEKSNGLLLESMLADENISKDKEEYILYNMIIGSDGRKLTGDYIYMLLKKKLKSDLTMEHLSLMYCIEEFKDPRMIPILRKHIKCKLEERSTLDKKSDEYLETTRYIYVVISVVKSLGGDAQDLLMQ